MSEAKENYYNHRKRVETHISIFPSPITEYVNELEKKNAELVEAVKYFVRRVEQGIIRSKTTYNLYVNLLEKIEQKPIEEIMYNAVVSQEEER